MRITDTPYDAAMTRSKQELARQLVDTDARIEALEAALRKIADSPFTGETAWRQSAKIARAALDQSSPPKTQTPPFNPDDWTTRVHRPRPAL